MEFRTRIAALAVAGLALAACTSSTDPELPVIPTPSADVQGTLTVWLMSSSYMSEVIDYVNDEFAEAYPDVTVEVELQQWAGIQETLSDALGSDSPPDIVEIGNTITARYADAGVLAALDPAAFDVDGMLPGLQPSGAWQDQRYGIPFYGGVKSVVAYRLSEFEAAEVEVPTTMAELADVAAALQEQNADNDEYSAFYFPGRYWYGALPFVWDAGGDIAVQEGDSWIGALDTAESRAGLTTLKELVDAYSKAPRDAEAEGNVEAFATGNVGMMVDSWWVPGSLSVGELAGDVGAFALPGSTDERTAPVFVGGSDLAVAEGSPNKGVAVEWLRILTGEQAQVRVAASGVIPNREGGFEGHEGNAFLQVADEAALVSRFTPVSPRWAEVEVSQALPDMLERIFTGEASVEDATAEASESIARTLNR
jgi:N,N'-diacetylchitobiose transport system substrate-binding protein